MLEVVQYNYHFTGWLAYQAVHHSEWCYIVVLVLFSAADRLNAQQWHTQSSLG